MNFLLHAITRGYSQRLILLIIIDCIFFTETNAKNISSIFLFIGFMLMVLTAYYLWRTMLGLISFYGFNVKRPRYLSICLSVITGGALALQSVGELAPRDLAVLLPLALITYLYSSYSGSAKRSADKV